MTPIDSYDGRSQLAAEADQYVRSYFRQQGCRGYATGIEHIESGPVRRMLAAIRDDRTPVMQEHISPIAARATYSPDNLIWHPHTGYFDLETKCRWRSPGGFFTADADAILEYQARHSLGAEYPAIGFPVVIAFVHMEPPRRRYACFANELKWDRTIYVPDKPGVWEWNRDRWEAKQLGPVEIVPWNRATAKSGNPYIRVYDHELLPIAHFWQRMMAWPANWRDLAFDVTLDKLATQFGGDERKALEFIDLCHPLLPPLERAA